MNKIKKLLAILIFLSTATLATAHPHMFISTTEEFVFTDNKLQGLWMEWTFDSYFSADIDFYYDWDNNNYFDKAETEEIFNNAFMNLENYNFFTFIRQGATRTTPQEVHNFSCRQNKEGILTYRFYIDLSSYEGKEIYISIYDFTYFCNIETKEENIKFTKNNSTVNIEHSIEQNKDYPVYYNPYGPASDNTVYTKWKKGLETFYPLEIHIKYN